ncbi:MAG: ribonuclease HII [Bacilli bacterium]|nr:ribonuclease HII [Bacilli bacterium]
MSLNYQEQFYTDDINLIVGVDEAGRGPLAGPVVAAAVIFSRAYINIEINDSKKLTEKKREYLFKVIQKDAIAIGVGIVSPDKIDEINIYEATKVAMKEAIKNLNCNFDLVLTDAMKLNGLSKPVIDIIKGDAKALPIAAASIIAKVTRDHLMNELANKYPQYGFEKHKGYGTKVHLDALKKFGPIEHVHRFTFKPVIDVIYRKMNLFEDF